jgi:WD40 repeat protein
MYHVPFVSRGVKPKNGELSLDVTGHWRISPVRSILSLSFIFSCWSMGLTAEPVSFVKQLAPILSDKCLTCHQESKAKGAYRVDTFERLLKPGDTDEMPFMVGKADVSSFYQRLITHDEDDRMPQKDDPLPAEQIELFRRWINEGAKFDGKDPRLTLSDLTPRQMTAPEKYRTPLPITALVWMPDGKSIITSGYREVLQWDETTGALLQRIPNLPERVFSLSLHYEGKWLAVAGGTPGKSGEVVIYDLGNKKILKRLPNAKDTMLSVVFSADGKWLAAGGSDSRVRNFKTADWTLAWTSDSHADWVNSLVFSPDSRHLLSSSRDRTSRIFASETGKAELSHTKHDSSVTASIFDKEGKVIFSGSNTGELRRWALNSDTDGEGSAQDKVLFSNRVEVTGLAILGDKLLSTVADGRVLLSEMNKSGTNKSFAAVKKRINLVSLSPDGTHLALGGAGGRIEIIEAATSKVIRSWVAAPGW